MFSNTDLDFSDYIDVVLSTNTQADPYADLAKQDFESNK